MGNLGFYHQLMSLFFFFFGGQGFRQESIYFFFLGVDFVLLGAVRRDETVGRVEGGGELPGGKRENKKFIR